MSSRIKRWAVRLIGVGILVVAGMVAYRVAKIWPRCVIASDTQAIHFSADGATLITGHELICIGNVTGGGSGAGKPPLQVWDTRSGKLVRSLLNDVETFKRYAVCEKRTLIAVALDGTIRFADWQTGEEWNIEVGPAEVPHLTFSPRGDLLAVRAEGQLQPEAMIDLARRAIVHRFEREARGSWFNADGSRWYYNLRGRMHAWNTTTHEVEAEVAEGSLYAEDRFYVHRSAEDLDLVLRDGASLAEKVRLRLAPPPELRAVKSIDAELRGRIHDCRHIAFSPSGRRAATFAEPFDAFDGVLEIWDTGTGRQVAAFPELKRGWGGFHVDDDLFVFMDRSHTPRDATTVANLGDRIFDVVTMVDLASGMIRWRIPTRQFAAIYVLRKDTAVHATREGTWEIFDAVTGESRCSQPHPFAAGAFVAVDSKDQRLVYAFGKRRAAPLPPFWDKWLGKWLGAESGGVQVLDTVSDRLVLDLHTDAGVGAVLSEDSRTLLTQDLAGIGFGRGRGSGSPHFRFYDLDSKKPWFWAASVPAGLLGLAWLWRRWRNWRKRGTNVPSAGLVLLPGPAH
jgi:WD40 repeat protein